VSRTYAYVIAHVVTWGDEATVRAVAAPLTLEEALAQLAQRHTGEIGGPGSPSSGQRSRSGAAAFRGSLRKLRLATPAWAPARHARDAYGRSRSSTVRWTSLLERPVLSPGRRDAVPCRLVVNSRAARSRGNRRCWRRSG
jgi:hypothetical protein